MLLFVGFTPKCRTQNKPWHLESLGCKHGPKHLEPIVVFASFDTIQRLLVNARLNVQGSLKGPVVGSMSVLDTPTDQKSPCYGSLFD